jgi:hypothetical protein
MTLSKEMEKIPCTLGHYDAPTIIGNTGSNLGIDTIPIGVGSCHPHVSKSISKPDALLQAPTTVPGLGV